MPLILGITLGLVLLVGVFFSAALGGLTPGTAQSSCAASSRGGPVGDIPTTYLAFYQQAGAEYGIPWPVLAAIGSVESDHGRSHAPGIHSGTNPAGAMGPMQFLAGTWEAYAIDGDHDGQADVYDPADAIPTAAHYLTANGAPQHLAAALWRYNHADWYVRKVLDKAKEYAAIGGPDGSSPGVCLPPVPPDAVAAQVVTYAHAQLGRRYAWGAEGPGAFDCSGLTMAAYQSAGIHLPRTSAEQWQHTPHIPRGQEQPGDLVFFDSGPGSTPDRPGHVGIVIGHGQMIAAPHTGTVVQIQPYSRQSLIGFARPVGQ